MTSCLTVTRPGKLDELHRAVICFTRQTAAEKELIIVHDGGFEFHQAVDALIARYTEFDMRVYRETPGLSLGALRNLAVEYASFDLVCQWDDDDLYHPARLEVQLAQLSADNADFCFFTDQLHYFQHTGELYWDDWMVETYPMNLIQGTLLGDKNKLGRYADLGRGEDTPVVVGLVDRGCSVTELAGRGYLYVYVYNGKNAWGLDHHAAISAWKRRRQAYLLEHEAELRRYTAAYDWPGRQVYMPHEQGMLRLL